LASEILSDIRTLGRKIADLNERIESEVEASGTTLTEIFGIGPILAAKIIGTVGNVVRFPTPRPTTSPPTVVRRRWRPLAARGGAPQALAGRKPQAQQSALHMVAVCQARSDARGGAYYRKKMAEGKSRKEALRCLKRRISDAVFKSLLADSRAPSRSVA
jgi:transposase